MILGTNAKGVFNRLSVVQLDRSKSQKRTQAQHKHNSTRQKKLSELSEPFISIVFPSFSPRKKKQIIAS